MQTSFSSGLSIWLIAAGALVAGILIGFTTGYEAGRRADSIVAGQTFTENAITEPARVDPEPVVAEPTRIEPEPIVPEPLAPSPPSPVPPQPAPARRVERTPPVERTVSGTGSLQVLSRPAGAQVVLNGRPIGRTPLVVPDIRAGGHDIRLELQGFRRWATTVQVSPGERTRVAASLEQ